MVLHKYQARIQKIFPGVEPPTLKFDKQKIKKEQTGGGGNFFFLIKWVIIMWLFVLFLSSI